MLLSVVIKLQVKLQPLTFSLYGHMLYYVKEHDGVMHFHMTTLSSHDNRLSLGAMYAKSAHIFIAFGLNHTVGCYRAEMCCC